MLGRIHMMRCRILTLFSVLFCFFANAFAGTATPITAPRVVAIATSPRAVAVGDVNADGTPDIVVAGAQGQVQVVLHHADESFQTAAIYQIHDGLTGVAVLPASASMKAGIALASSTGKLYFLTGNGDGTFGDPSSPVAVSSSLISIALGDANALGHSRVVALDAAGIAFLVDPDTRASSAVASVPGATRIVTADFDQDGFLDIAFASPAGVSVAFGKGNGAFVAPVLISGTAPVVSIAACDLDGLGVQSLIASDVHGTLTFLTPSKRVFQTIAQLTTETSEFAAADLDHDGKADLAVSSPVTHEITFYHGLGRGQFASAQVFGAGSPMSGLAATGGMAGLISDRSGVIAVISTETPVIATSPAASPVVTAGSSSSSSSGSGSKAKGNAAPAGASTVTLSATPNPVSYGHATTFTATVSPLTATGKVTFYDSYTVIGIASLASGVASLGTVSLQPGARSITARYDGDANDLGSVSAPYIETVTDIAALGFASPQYISPGPEPSTVVTGDFNNDGHLDIVALTTDPSSGAGTAAFIAGTGYGTFGAPAAFNANQTPYGAVVADFNGDGNPDLGITAGVNSNGAIIPVFEVLLGNGNGTFQAPLTNTVPYNPATPPVPPDGVAAGDFNRDGIVDVVTANDLDNSITVFIGNGNGTFQAGVTYPVCTNCTAATPTGQNPVAVAVSDFNRDGIPDLAVANSNDGTVTIFLGTGTGYFTMQTPFSVSTSSQATAIPQDIAAFDTNGDGIPDLVITDAANAVVIVLTGLGNGAFGTPATYPVGNTPEGLATGDFNGDLVTDVVVANSSDNTYSVLLGSKTGGFTTGSTIGGCVGTCYWLDPAVGDFNGDSISDIVMADAGDLETTLPDPYPGLVDVFLGEGCSFNVNPNVIAFDNQGGVQQVSISASSPNCTWTASSPVPWVTVTPSVGVANQTPLTVIVQPNTSGAELTTTITIAGQSVPVTSWSTETVFQDVPPSNAFFDAINLFYQKGITSGCSANPLDFCPTADVTRAEMAVFIVRAVYGGDNFTLNQSTPYFIDVPEGSFGYLWIQKMYELGITLGCAPQYFCPTAPVTRDEMAVFITRMRFEQTPFTYPSTPYFTDVPTTDPDFPYVQRLAYDQITNGCQTNLYCPTEDVLREQMAPFILRGAFNELLPAGTPVITAIAPNTLAVGGTGTFTITGLNTTFQAEVTDFVPPPGITINSLTVNSPTSLTLSLTAAPSGVAVQPEPVYIQTGTQQAVLPNSLIIQ